MADCLFPEARWWTCSINSASYLFQVVGIGPWASLGYSGSWFISQTISLCVCVRVCAHARKCVRMRECMWASVWAGVCVGEFVCMWASVCVHMFVCLCACVHVCVLWCI